MATPKQSQPLSLAELNQRSAPLAAFNIGIVYPRIEDYEYNDKSNHKKKGATFRCLIVCLEDPQHYATAELTMRGTSRKPLEDAQGKFKAGLQFRMNSTRLKGNIKQEFLHTPLKLVIDLTATKFDPILQASSGDGAHLAAEPVMTTAQCRALRSPQRFDLTALIDGISDARPGGANREVRDVMLVDGSKERSSDKLVEVKFSYFINTTPNKSEAEFLDLVTKVNGTNRAISLFAIQGKPTGDGYVFSPSKDFFVFEASGSKANDLTSIHQQVALVPKCERVTLQSSFTPHERRDWTQEQGIQVFSLHLKDLLRPTNIPEIDDNPTLWQLNWTEVAWPAFRSDPITTKDGDRLWFQTSVRDLAGVQNDVWMNENSALQLSRANNKEQFIQAWQDGDQLFPIMAAVKILRSSKPSSHGDAHPVASAKSKDDSAYVNYVIVEASDQPLDEAPTKATLPLVEMLKEPSHDPNSIVPAGLDQIAASPTYAFEVSYNVPGISEPIVVPCQKVLALIRSQTKSSLETLGNGYKLTTPDIKCLLGSHHAPPMANPFAQGCGGEHPTAKTYTVTSVCTLENLVSYRLDPTRQSTSQCALVSITNKVNDTFVVESVQLLTEEEAQKAETSLRSLMHLVMHLGKRDPKRSVTWTDGLSPLSARKSTRLGRAPTDAPLPAPEEEA